MVDPTSPVRLFIRARLHAFTVGIAVLVAASFAGRFHWSLDLTTHFRAQYALAAGALLIGCLAVRSYRFALAPLALVLINLWFLAPFYLPYDEPTPAPAKVERLKIVSLNVHAGSRAYNDVIAYIRNARPDFVVLTEVTQAWLAGLQPLDDEYPELHYEARLDAFGIALLSKRPLINVRIHRLERDSPCIRATCQIDGQEFTLFGIHPPPPMNAELAQQRNDAFMVLNGLVREVAGATIVVGDFNATSWSPHFIDLLTETRLRDSRLGRGLQPSWSLTHPAPLHIPIDHILVSPEIHIFERRTGPKVGSDHRPVEMEFCLRR